MYVCVFQCGSNTQLLHVFQEDFILGYKPHEDFPDFNITSVPSGEGTKPFLFFEVWFRQFFQNITIALYLFLEYQPPPFSEKFYLVVIEKDANRNSVLQMWHLHLRSVQACVGAYDVGYLWNDDTAVGRQLMRGNCEGSLMNGKLILPLMTNLFFRDGNYLEGNDALIYPLGINNVHLHCVLWCLYISVDICFCLSVPVWDEFNIITVMIDYGYILFAF